MPIFSQQQGGQSNPFEEQQRVINEIIRRVNDMDRRVRLEEQANMNQKQTIDNMNENFVKLRDELMERIRIVESKTGLDKIDGIDKGIRELKERTEGLPTRVELAKMRTFIAGAAPTKDSELDDALATIEMLTKPKEPAAKKEVRK